MKNKIKKNLFSSSDFKQYLKLYHISHGHYIEATSAADRKRDAASFPIIGFSFGNNAPYVTELF